MNNELRERIRQHFTKGELVEFLPLSLTELIELCEEHIIEHYTDIAAECCFEFEDTNED